MQKAFAVIALLFVCLGACLSAVTERQQDAQEASRGYAYNPQTGIWRNWDYTVSAQPQNYFEPQTEAEIVAIVTSAYNRNGRIRAVGGSHSWQGLVVTNDVMLSLNKYNRVLGLDGPNRLRVQAGIRIYKLIEDMAAMNLQLPNYATITQQSIAGAISTGTHGTGQAWGAYATMVDRLRLVLANGSVVEASESQNPDLFAAARGGLGLFGIITDVWLKVEPLQIVEYGYEFKTLDFVMANYKSWLNQGLRFSWSWVNGNTNNVKIRWYNVTNKPYDPAVKCTGYEVRPTYCRDISAYAMASTPEFATNLFYEQEMFVPVEYTDDVIRAFNNFWNTDIAKAHWKSDQVALLGLRHVRGDPITWLSPSYNRNTTTFTFLINGNRTHNGDFGVFSYFAKAFDNICKNFNCRLHWGKEYFVDASDFKNRYDRWDDFLRVRQQVDPKQIFVNDWACKTILGDGCKPAGAPGACEGGSYPDYRGCCPKKVQNQFMYRDWQGCYPDSNGRYPDYRGCYPDANGVYTNNNEPCPLSRQCTPECVTTQCSA